MKNTMIMGMGENCVFNGGVFVGTEEGGREKVLTLKSQELLRRRRKTANKLWNMGFRLIV